MKNSRIVRTAAVAAVLFATIGANAQSEASSKSIPLHVEASLGACTPSNKVLPLDVNVDLNYTLPRDSRFMPQQPLRISCQRTAQRTTTIALRIWVEA